MFIWRYGRGEHVQSTGRARAGLTIKTISDKRLRQSRNFAWSMFIAMAIKMIGYYCPGYYIEHVGTVVMVGAIVYGLNMTFNQKQQGEEES